MNAGSRYDNSIPRIPQPIAERHDFGGDSYGYRQEVKSWARLDLIEDVPGWKLAAKGPSADYERDFQQRHCTNRQEFAPAKGLSKHSVLVAR